MPILSMSLMEKYWIPRFFRITLKRKKNEQVSTLSECIHSAQQKTQLNLIRCAFSNGISYKCLLFTGIHISQADVNQIPGGEKRLHPRKSWDIRNLWGHVAINFSSESSSCSSEHECHFEGKKQVSRNTTFQEPLSEKPLKEECFTKEEECLLLRVM